MLTALEFISQINNETQQASAERQEEKNGSKWDGKELGSQRT